MEDKVIVQEDLNHKAGYELTVRTHRVYQMVYFILGVIETILGIRFFFKLFGANPQSIFVTVIYGISNVLILPFSGVFQRGSETGEGVQKIFDPSTIVAGIIYLLITYFTIFVK